MMDAESCWVAGTRCNLVIRRVTDDVGSAEMIGLQLSQNRMVTKGDIRWVEIFTSQPKQARSTVT